MSTLQRYVLREFLKIAGICFFGLLGIYLLVDFFQRIDLFLNYPTAVRWKLLYFALKLPLFVFHIVPVTMLVAVLVTIGVLARHREITAARCAGVTLVHLALPLAAAGLVASALVFLTNEYVVPATTRQSQYVLDVLIKNRPMRSIFRQNRIWYYGERNTIWNIQLLDPVEHALEGVTLFWLDRTGTRLVRRLDARSARYVNGRWWFRSGTIRSFRESGVVHAQQFGRRSLRRLAERPGDISQYRERPEEMNLRSLAEYVRKLRRSGFNSAAYEVDLHTKASLPLVSLVVTLLAIPFAFRSGARGGIFASLGASLALGFAYWVVISIAISLGHAGKLSPLMAAWMPNLFFLGVALYFWLSLEL